jgi:hypothetical protein
MEKSNLTTQKCYVLNYVLERILSARARLNLSNVLWGEGGDRVWRKKRCADFIIIYSKMVGYTVQKI